MQNFEGLGLSPSLADSLAAMKYSTPTPIQAQAIPMALEGRDIMGTAQTGTGKTAAFAIPLVESLLRNPEGMALVLTPTRELGKQVMDVIRQLLGPKSGIRSAFLIGGESIMKQRSQLKSNPRLIVGTPGRINDHLRNRALNLKETRFLVLDETDRMLDMGFSVQIDEILKHMPGERQTLLFSATLPQNILKLSAKYMNNPARVAVGSTEAPAKNIKQEILYVEDGAKYDELVKQLNERNGSVIVFVKTKHNTEKVAKKLSRDGFEADAIHGDLKQRQRDRVISQFRDMNFRVLVATDVAARGLDIPHIEHVINYDLPQVAEDYIHRIGRTARAGAEGSSLCLISGGDKGKWRMIEELMDPTMKRERPQQGNRKPQRNGGRNRRFGNEEKRSFGGAPRKFAGKPKFEGKREYSNDRPQKPQGEWKRKAPSGESNFVEPRSEKPQGERKFSGEKTFKPRGDWKKDSGGERKFGDKPKFEGKREYNKDRADKPKGEWNRKPRAEGEVRKFEGKKPQGEWKRKAPDGERKFSGERAFKPKGDWKKDSGGERKFGDKPKFEGKREYSNDRPQRPQGEWKRKPRPEGEARKFDGERPQKPQGEWKRKAPDGERKFSGEKTFKPKGHWKKKPAAPQKNRHVLKKRRAV